MLKKNCTASKHNHASKIIKYRPDLNTLFSEEPQKPSWHLGFAFSQEQVATAAYKVLIAMFFTTVANHIGKHQISFYSSLVK